MMKRLLSKIALELLEIIKDEGEFMVELATTPYGKLRLDKIPKQTYYSNLRRMEQAGWIKKKKKNYRNAYILTELGKQLLKRPKKAIKRDDGASTLIIFDIPEGKSKQRTIFRRFLIRNGYTLLQKSVLISPNKITPDIKDLIHELEIKNYVSVLSAKVDHL